MDNANGNDPARAGGRLGDLSRRAFLRRGTMTAAAVGMVGSVPGLTDLLAGGASEAPAVESSATEAESDAGGVAQPVLAQVKNLSTGDISLFHGEREILVRDPALARLIVSATRS